MQSIKPGSQNVMWLTWENQRRNRSLSRLLGVPLFELTSQQGRLKRYLTLSRKTLNLLRQQKPHTVFAQNPSILLSLLVVLAKRRWHYRAVIDEHNAGLFPLEGRSRLLGAVARFIVREADLVIVTTQGMRLICEQWGSRALIMPDPLPHFDGKLLTRARAFCTESPPLPLRALFICSWAEDEPHQHVIDAMHHFPPGQLQLAVTGNPRDRVCKETLPQNVTLLGFLSEEDYLVALAECHFVVVLTEREDCLNCGAYEAVAMEKPGLLADTQALRGYFQGGFVFSRTDKEGIISGLEQMMGDYQALCQQVAWLKRKLTQAETVPDQLLVQSHPGQD